MHGVEGPSAYSCLIEIELFKDAPPPVTVHEPPQIIRSETPNDPEVQT
jgi:biotin/methionine sulfoxide reductase